MKRGFMQGTFDILNVGHLQCFALARESCDELIIGLNSDALVRSERGRDPILPYTQRKAILEALRIVDSVIECDDKQAMRYLKELQADVFIVGSEWVTRQADEMDWVGEVVISPRFPDILCSSDIRTRIQALT